MMPRHHLDEATVVSYAAGALSPEMAAVAGTHLESCRHCRAILAGAERVGGELLRQQQPAEADTARAARLRQAMLERLDDAPKAEASPPVLREQAEGRVDPDDLPRPLQKHFGRSWSALRWRWMAPGVHMIRAPQASGHSLILLKIGPGRGMPVHSHGGTELTQILQGAYDDDLGHFGPGDIADLGPDTEHRPVTSPGVPCICVAALDAPLRFPGWVARKLQPLIGL